MTLVVAMLVGVTSTNSVNYVNINFDYQTIAAMVGTYAAEVGIEALHEQNTADILKSYEYSEVATAGIFASKLLDRNALKSVKGFNNPDENYYYQKIYRLVGSKILPRTIMVAQKLVRDPATTIYWGSYLLRVITDTKSLCNEFSAVVTNSQLNFDDLPFLTMTDALKNVVDLERVSNLKSLFDNLAEIGNGSTEEDAEVEFASLENLAVGLASAGSNNESSSRFDNVFQRSVGNISSQASNTALFSQLSSNAGSTLSSLISGDPTDMTKLFSTGSGSGNSWISSYNTGSDQQYYTRKVYVYHIDSGSETLCQYNPPTDNDNILNGDHYTRFSTDQKYYNMSTAERQQALQNSYNHAGWSQDMVNQKNASNDGYTYYMSTWSHGYSCYHTRNGEFDGYYAYAIAYSITVTKSWYNKEIYYEDTFDSYSMDWSTFINVMQEKLNEANRNEEGKVYRIGYDSKKYYIATNARKLAGASLATFTSNCSSNGKLVDGNIQYKCNDCGDNPSEHTKECSMETSLTSAYNYDEINNAISSTESEMSSVQTQIDQYNARNKEILNLLSKVSGEESTALRDEYQHNRNEIAALQSQYDSLNDQLTGYKSAKQEAIDFENSQTDSSDRIPNAMHTVQSNFSLEWIDEGHWEGYTFVRQAHMKNLNSVVTFRATVSISRGPKYFLFIKIHRAIVKISWELTAEYNDSEVLETMQLDPDGDAEAQATKVNQKLSELRLSYPDCDIEVSYERSSSLQEDTDDDDDKIHLVWASDRLDVAREVCHRLEAIYVDLVVLDKYLTYRFSILDWLQDQGSNILNTDRGRRLTIAERSRRRWMHNGGSALFGREEEDDNYEED